MNHTLTVLDSNGELIDLKIINQSEFPNDLYIFHIDSNTLMLGDFLIMEWNHIMGDSIKQKDFIAKAKKVSKTIIENL